MIQIYCVKKIKLKNQARLSQRRRQRRKWEEKMEEKKKEEEMEGEGGTDIGVLSRNQGYVCYDLKSDP